MSAELMAELRLFADTTPDGTFFPLTLEQARSIVATERAAELRGVRAGIEAARDACQRTAWPAGGAWASQGDHAHPEALIQAIRALDPETIEVPRG